VGGTLRVIGKVLGRLRPYRLAFTGAVLQVLLSGLLELAKPWPLKVVVDNVLGGRITLESAEGDGSRFVLTLPRVAPLRDSQLPEPETDRPAVTVDAAAAG